MVSDHPPRPNLLEGRSVLVVEDNPLVREALCQMFLRRGARVSAIGTVELALASLKPCPDWIILDLMLPDGNGCEVLHAVQRQGCAATRTVVITGANDPEILDRAMALNPLALLSKPVTFAQIVEAMNG